MNKQEYLELLKYRYSMAYDRVQSLGADPKKLDGTLQAANAELNQAKTKLLKYQNSPY